MLDDFLPSDQDASTTAALASLMATAASMPGLVPSMSPHVPASNPGHGYLPSQASSQSQGGLASRMSGPVAPATFIPTPGSALQSGLPPSSMPSQDMGMAGAASLSHFVAGLSSSAGSNMRVSHGAVHQQARPGLLGSTACSSAPLHSSRPGQVCTELQCTL